MKLMERYLEKVHPVIKMVFYIQLLGIAIWGPLISSILVTIICFLFMIFYSGEKGIIANPYYALLFCTVAVLIVIPGGSIDEIIYASELSARILNIMLISAILGLMIKPNDILLIGKLIRLPYEIIMVIIAIALFIPIATRSIQHVIFAQRSRGLELSFSSIFRPTTYLVLIIPYVVCVLQSALALWVSVNLRPWSVYKISKVKINVIEVFLLLISFVLWIDYNI